MGDDLDDLSLPLSSPADDEDDEEEGGGDAELEARMKRAMAEAAEEDSDMDEEGAEFSGMADEEEMGESSLENEEDLEEAHAASSDVEMDMDEFDDKFGESIYMDMDGLDEDPDLDEDSDLDSDEEEEEEELVPKRPSKSLKPSPSTAKEPKPTNANHLPDELFSAAFQNSHSSVPKSTKKNLVAEEEEAKKKNKKRRKQRRGAKDLVLGTKKIKILPSSSTDQTPSLPSTIAARPKIAKFLNRTLALSAPSQIQNEGDKKTKGDKRKGTNARLNARQSVMGWERRAANIGILQQQSRKLGPAAHFVRNV
ncbi:hypothetical protein BKA70DRAFT_1312199 [Coprinopsis sp. MPI-PUGE-AT-0042]|nr:hypothetical protein BKA70DRAFT_1312199 [Coprinopsis sp. MPI-PUGE-AT-0042]